MTFDGAVIKEQGVTFGIIVVNPHVLDDTACRDRVVAQAAQAFGGVPTVLMAQQHSQARYYGRTDLVRFMAGVPLAAVPWKRYQLGAVA